MANGAPVCPISRDQPVSGMPGVLIPAVPRAMDLPSLIQAVNAIGAGLRTPNLNNVAPWIMPHGQPVLAGQNNGGSTVITSDWDEVGRTTDNLTVYHYDGQKVDQEQYLEVERIFQVNFSPAGASANGGMTWNWPQEQSDMINEQ